MATGYQPYRDDTTGFTRFTDVRAQVPAIQASGLPPPGGPPQPGQDPAALLDSVERQIAAAAATLQQMQQPTGAPAAPAPAAAVPDAQVLFGLAAARRSQAVQQLEGLVGQREAARASMAGASGGGEGGAGAGGLQQP